MSVIGSEQVSRRSNAASVGQRAAQRLSLKVRRENDHNEPKTHLLQSQTGMNQGAGRLKSFLPNPPVT